MAPPPTSGPNVQALCEAAGKDDVSAIAVMIDYKLAAVNGRGDKGVSALDAAAKANSLAAATLLLDRGADVHSKNSLGRTSLDRAAVHGSTEVATLLLDRGADIHCQDDVVGYMPIHSAIQEGQLACATMLLDRGARLEGRANTGARPLHGVCFKDSHKCAKLLLHRGADVNAQSESGYAPLHAAAWKNSLACAKVLLDGGADPSLVTGGGMTPLQVAVMRGNHDEMAQFLRRHMRLRVLLRCATEAAPVTMADLCVEAEGNKEEDAPPAEWTVDDVAVLWPHRDVLRAAATVWQRASASMAAVLGKRKRPTVAVQAPAQCLWPDVLACLDAWEAAIVRAPTKGTEDDVSDIIASYF